MPNRAWVLLREFLIVLVSKGTPAMNFGIDELQIKIFMGKFAAGSLSNAAADAEANF
jgi:hypothetical protein